jgi:hypothetical protein
LQVPDDLIAQEIGNQTSLPLRERAERDEDERRACIEKAKDNVARHKEVRREKEMVQAYGEPYQVGDIVRYKLNDDVRSRSYGGKIAPRYSEPYQVIKVTNSYTYAIKPVEGSSRGRNKVRHFNQLKTVKRTKQTGVTSNNLDGESDTPTTEVGEPSTEGEEVTESMEEQSGEFHEDSLTPTNVGTRWSTRHKKKTSFLQADGNRKSYD